MRTLVQLFGIVAIATLAFAPTTTFADDDVTMKGSFIWLRDGNENTGDLSAVLTPVAEDEWTVAFHFVWEDESHVYMGSANGSLDAGPLEGTAESDDEDHKLFFRFSGSSENGTFTGTHSFVKKDGSLQEAGSLTLSRTS